MNEKLYKFETAKAYQDWLTDPARKEGDKTLLDNELGESYAMLYFIRREKPNEPTADIRQIVINTGLNSKRNRDEFNSDEEYDEYKKELEEKKKEIPLKTAEMLKKWKDSNREQSDFIKLYEEYSSYKDNNLGLFRYQPQANFVKDIGDWVFSEERKDGDMKAFLTEDYATFIYVESLNGPIWESAVGESIKKEKVQKEISEKVEEYLK